MSTVETAGAPFGDEPIGSGEQVEIGRQIRSGEQIRTGEQIRAGEQKEARRRPLRRRSGRISSGMVISVAAAAGLAASSAAFGSVSGGHFRSMAAVITPPATANGRPTAGDLEASANLMLSRYLKVAFGPPHTELDESGLVMSTVPVTITNITGHSASFNLEFAARDAEGRLITTDSAVAPNLAAGQTAQLRVFNIVNNTLVPRLLAAHYSVSNVVAN